MKNQPHQQQPSENNLHKRFIKWVLLPPFIALIILGLLGLWNLDGLLRRQALADLDRSAETTATVLERELNLRRDVLKRTGSEMLLLKSQFTDLRTELESNYSKCREYILQTFDYTNSPKGVCDPFASELANRGLSLGVLEDRYIELARLQVDEQTARTNERLGAFKQIFPESLAVVVVDKSNQVVSSALSGVLKGSTEPFTPYTLLALNEPVQGTQVDLEGFRLGMFAYPIADGAVLAAYDLYNDNFLKRTWDSAPIDRSQALAVFLDAQNRVAYPNTSSSKQLRENGDLLKAAYASELALDGVDHTAVASEAGDTGWSVVIASPTAAVLAPSRDAQLLSLIVICLFVIGFIWVGSFFIQRTLANIVRLMSGALIFSTGRLDYKIELDHADSEFVRLGETMNKMAERIAAAERAIDEKNKEFISIATHEIRAPLTAVIGHLSMLQDMYASKLDKNATLMLDQAYEGSTRLRDLVNDMLNVARLESGRSETTLSPVEVAPMVRDVISTMDVVAKLNNVNLHYDEPTDALVTADEAKLHIIINNFVSNAIKYNKPNGDVYVAHQEYNGYLQTSIKDTGLGIPKEQKAHMFEKFFRVNHEDRKAVTGTGLGMYVVRQYVEHMGGKLWFDSEHGKGTTFYFTLPLAELSMRHKMQKKIRRTVKRVRSKASKARKNKKKNK